MNNFSAVLLLSRNQVAWILQSTLLSVLPITFCLRPMYLIYNKRNFASIVTSRVLFNSWIKNKHAGQNNQSLPAKSLHSIGSSLQQQHPVNQTCLWFLLIDIQNFQIVWGGTKFFSTGWRFCIVRLSKSKICITAKE